MREIELKPSRRLGVYLAAGMLLAWLAIARASLPATVQLALAAGTLVVGVWGWRRQRLPPLRIASDGALHVLDDAGEWREIAVMADSFVSPALIVLRFRLGGGRAQACVLLPDSASADDLRRLRTSLRWIRRTRSGTSSPGAG
ncbi:MAG: hypothetical protein LDL19_11290 [Thiobacillus sp.]|nr:hypothetical protein [Thiobacillus sp.]